MRFALACGMERIQQVGGMHQNIRINQNHGLQTAILVKGFPPERFFR
jgi:hypothetical protein